MRIGFARQAATTITAYRCTLGALALTSFLGGCGVCNLDTGCEPAVCTVPERVLEPGAFITASAVVHEDACNIRVTATDLNGLTIRLVEKQPPNTELDGNPQVVAIDSDWRYKLDRASLKCGAGWGYSDPTTLSDGGCSWTSSRSAPFSADSKDTWTLLLNDYRSNPVGTCWTGPSSCRVAYSFTIHRVGP